MLRITATIRTIVSAVCIPLAAYTVIGSAGSPSWHRTWAANAATTEASDKIAPDRQILILSTGEAGMRGGPRTARATDQILIIDVSAPQQVNIARQLVACTVRVGTRVAILGSVGMNLYHVTIVGGPHAGCEGIVAQRFLATPSDQLDPPHRAIASGVAGSLPR